MLLLKSPISFVKKVVCLSFVANICAFNTHLYVFLG